MAEIKFYITLILQKIGFVVFFILYKIFVRIEILGKENLRGLSGPIILAFNHTSELDVTAIPLVLPFSSKLFPIYFVQNPIHKFQNFGWRSYFYNEFILNILGGYSIYSGQKNYALSLEKHTEILANGGTVCIFPEGKRTLDGNFNPARGGVAFLAWQTGAMVVPIAIDTFFNISALDFFTFRRKVYIKIGEPMSTNEIISQVDPTVADFQIGAQKVLDEIKKLMN